MYQFFFLKGNDKKFETLGSTLKYWKYLKLIFLFKIKITALHQF